MKLGHNHYIVRLLLLFCFVFSLPAYSKNLKLMVYNVENLFDTLHDQGKNDWAFTPKGTVGKLEACEKMRNPYYKKSCIESDWTESKLKIKLGQIKRVLTAENGTLPEILTLVEIENDNVVKKLASFLGYDSQIVSVSKDNRGIDLAILYNSSIDIQKINILQHELIGGTFKKRPSRDILEAEFLIGGRFKLNLFVNHWPSLSNPTANRLIAAQTLKMRIGEILKEDIQRNIIAVGDFNTIPENYPHPFKSILLKDDLMIDLHGLHKEYLNKISNIKEIKNTVGDDIRNGLRRGNSLGSYFYGKTMSWNLLDRIFINSNLLDKRGLDVKVSSYKIEATSFNTKTYFYDRRGHYNYGTSIVGTPMRYNFRAKESSKAGFSDHFPLSVNLRFF